MAIKITVNVLGGETSTHDGVATVADAAAAIGLVGDNYAATINGSPADFDDLLDDYEYVSFSQAVKGGAS